MDRSSNRDSLPIDSRNPIHYITGAAPRAPPAMLMRAHPEAAHVRTPHRAAPEPPRVPPPPGAARGRLRRPDPGLPGPGSGRLSPDDRHVLAGCGLERRDDPDRHG